MQLGCWDAIAAIVAKATRFCALSETSYNCKGTGNSLHCIVFNIRSDNLLQNYESSGSFIGRQWNAFEILLVEWLKLGNTRKRWPRTNRVETDWSIFKWCRLISNIMYIHEKKNKMGIIPTKMPRPKNLGTEVHKGCPNCDWYFFRGHMEAERSPKHFRSAQARRENTV